MRTGVYLPPSDSAIIVMFSFFRFFALIREYDRSYSLISDVAANHVMYPCGPSASDLDPVDLHKIKPKFDVVYMRSIPYTYIVRMLHMLMGELPKITTPTKIII